MALARQRIRAAYEEACRREIEALKPGNVHTFADGHRMSADDFRTSARVSSAPLTEPGLSTGQRILEAVRATRAAVGTNTNLGIMLLCAPIARAAEMPGPLRRNLPAVLGAMGVDDAAAVFDAIVLAEPGGLGSAAANDVREPASVSLVEAMREAAGRDSIARQYASGFAGIFEVGLPALQRAIATGEGGMWPTVFAYLEFLAEFPDSHVARKHGEEIAARVRRQALGIRSVLGATAGEAARIGLLMEFDRALKAEGVNPGTSADLTVACLLVHILGDELAQFE